MNLSVASHRVTRMLVSLFAVVAVAAGLGFTYAPVPPQLPYGVWEPWGELKAVSGGGCMGWGAGTLNIIVVSTACGSNGAWTEFEYRFIDATHLQIGNVFHDGTSVDLAHTAQGNGGVWIWEKANDSLVFNYYPLGDGNFLIWQAGDHYPGPNGHNLPLKDIAPQGTESNAGWALEQCQGTDCTGGG